MWKQVADLDQSWKVASDTVSRARCVLAPGVRLELTTCGLTARTAPLNTSRYPSGNDTWRCDGTSRFATVGTTGDWRRRDSRRIRDVPLDAVVAWSRVQPVTRSRRVTHRSAPASSTVATSSRHRHAMRRWEKPPCRRSSLQGPSSGCSVVSVSQSTATRSVLADLVSGDYSPCSPSHQTKSHRHGECSTSRAHRCRSRAGEVLCVMAR